MMRGSKWSFARTAMAIAAVVSAGPLEAQLARPRVASPDSPKLLVVPMQRDNVDSVLSLLVADGMRERLRNNYLDRFNTITRQNLNENLVQSGFPTDVPLDGSTVRQLARFLNARLLIEGSMIRVPGDSMLIIARLQEAIGTQPQAVTAVSRTAIARTSSGTGGELVNRLVEGYRSFEDVQACRTALEQNNLPRAEAKARDGLRDYPNNASAYLCLTSIREAQRAEQSVIMTMLDSAYRADTLNVITMRRIAAKYEAVNDTANLLVYLRRILRIDFRDNELRTRTAQLLVRRGETQAALEVVDEGLHQNPASVELLMLKGLAYGAASRWDSAAANLELVASIDSQRVDSLFMLRIVTFYRQVPDTANWMKWLRTGTEKSRSNPDNWFMLGNLRLVRGDTAGAVEAARGLLAAIGESSEGANRGYRARALYLLANTYAGRGEFDSALVFAVQSVAADSTLRPSVAGVYIRAGLRSYQDSTWSTAIERLQTGKQFATGRTVVTAAFYLGLSQVRLGVQLDQQAEGERNCDTARRLPDIWNEAEQNIIQGAAQNRDAANQLLSQTIPAYKQRAGQLVTNICRS